MVQNAIRRKCHCRSAGEKDNPLEEVDKHELSMNAKTQNESTVCTHEMIDDEQSTNCVIPRTSHTCSYIIESTYFSLKQLGESTFGIPP